MIRGGYQECFQSFDIFEQNDRLFTGNLTYFKNGVTVLATIDMLHPVNAPRPKGRGFYRFCEQTASPV